MRNVDVLLFFKTRKNYINIKLMIMVGKQRGIGGVFL